MRVKGISSITELARYLGNARPYDSDVGLRCTQDHKITLAKLVARDLVGARSIVRGLTPETVIVSRQVRGREGSPPAKSIRVATIDDCDHALRETVADRIHTIYDEAILDKNAKTCTLFNRTVSQFPVV